MTSKSDQYQAELDRAVREERYEDAARWRDELSALKDCERAPKFPTAFSWDHVCDSLRDSFQESWSPRPYVYTGPVRLEQSTEDSTRRVEENHFAEKSIAWWKEMEKALWQVINDHECREVAEGEIKAYGVRVIDHRIGMENFFWKGQVVFVVDHTKGWFGKPTL